MNLKDITAGDVLIHRSRYADGRPTEFDEVEVIYVDAGFIKHINLNRRGASIALTADALERTREDFEEEVKP